MWWFKNRQKYAFQNHLEGFGAQKVKQMLQMDCVPRGIVGSESNNPVELCAIYSSGMACFSLTRFKLDYQLVY